MKSKYYYISHIQFETIFISMNSYTYHITMVEDFPLHRKICNKEVLQAQKPTEPLSHTQFNLKLLFD